MINSIRSRRRRKFSLLHQYVPIVGDDYKSIFLRYRKWYSPYFDFGLVDVQKAVIDTPARVKRIKGKLRDRYLILISDDLRRFLKRDPADEHLVHLIEHELWHIIFRHFERIPAELSCQVRGEGCKDCPAKKKVRCTRLWRALQIGNDLAINSLLGDLKLSSELMGQYPALYCFPELLSSEAYYDLLKGFGNLRKGKSKQDWEDLYGIVCDIGAGNGEEQGKQVDADGRMKDMRMQALMGEAARDASSKLDRSLKSQGRYEAYQVRLAAKLSSVSGYDINWDRLVKCGVLSGSKPLLIYRKYKIDKRYQTMPGVSLRLKTKLLIGIDTSGSVDAEQLALFKEKINKMNFPDAMVVECDAIIHKQYKLGKGLAADHEFKGGGGTSFLPVFDLAKQCGYNTVVYYTDGNGQYPDKDPGIQTIWVMSGGRRQVSWGEEVFIA